jgi:hypothetical protein
MLLKEIMAACYRNCTEKELCGKNSVLCGDNVWQPFGFTGSMEPIINGELRLKYESKLSCPENFWCRRNAIEIRAVVLSVAFPLCVQFV